MSLDAIADELADVVAAAAGVTCLDHIPMQPTTPSAYVGHPALVFGTAGREAADGSIEFEIPITFVVGLGDPSWSQNELRRHMSSIVPNAIAEHDGPWSSARPVRTTTPVITDNDLSIDLIVSLRAAL